MPQVLRRHPKNSADFIREFIRIAGRENARRNAGCPSNAIEDFERRGAIRLRLRLPRQWPSGRRVDDRRPRRRRYARLETLLIQRRRREDRLNRSQPIVLGSLRTERRLRPGFRRLEERSKVEKVRRRGAGRRLTFGGNFRRCGLACRRPYVGETRVQRDPGRRGRAPKLSPLLNRNGDNVGPDVQPIAISQEVRGVEPVLGAVDKGAVGRDVVKPVSAVAIANLAVLARDASAWVGQGPIEVRIAAKIETSSLDLDPYRAAVWEPINVFDR